MDRKKEARSKMEKQDGDRLNEGGAGLSPYDNDSRDGACNELILQGLRIFERLVSSHHNRREICSAPGVLSKITAPLYHATLVQDIKISCDWADVVDASFKVLCQLVVAPGKASRRLRREISSDKQALSNLESIILDQGDHQARRDLKMNANEILTQLALDPCISFPLETKENVISRQLSTFLENEGGEEDSMHRFHRSLAGRTVALLSSNSETNSAFILNRHDGIVARLTEKLGTADGIFALRILKNLCVHCTLNKDIVKETLLPKELKEC
nr:unnamed protein product [Digitaria exilis]